MRHWFELLPASRDPVLSSSGYIMIKLIYSLFQMLQLPTVAWVTFAAWTAIGALNYGLYGWRNASEEYRYKGLVPPNHDKNS